LPEIISLKVIPFQGKIHIISKNIILSPSQTKTLEKGLGFVPTRTNLNTLQRINTKVNEELEELQRILNWKIRFSGQPERPLPTFYIKSGNETSKNPLVSNFIRKVKKGVNKTMEEIKRELPHKKSSRIPSFTEIIRPSDKNLGPVVISKEDYLKEVGNQLGNTNFYCKVNRVDIPAIQQKIESIIQRNELRVEEEVLQFITSHSGFSNPTIPTFYINPKIHKNPWRGRPIIASVNWVTTSSSIVLDVFIQKLLKKFGANTIITNSTQVITKITSIQANSDTWMYSGDISEMYTNLKLSDCKTALNWFLMRDRNDNPVIPPSYHQFLSDLLEIVLENNFFSEPTLGLFRQINGIAMGSNCSAALANLTILHSEFKHMLYDTTRPMFYGRYIDDVLVIQNGTSIWRPPIPSYLKVICTPLSKKVDFLDLRLEIVEESIHFKVYQKELNTYSYPHFDSNIPTSIKKGFIKGEIIRYIRLSQTRHDFEIIKSLFMARLLCRGYTLNFVTPIFRQVPWCLKEHFMIIKNSNKRMIPLVFRQIFDKKISPKLQIKAIIDQHWNQLPSVLKNTKLPLIAQMLQPSIAASISKSNYLNCISFPLDIPAQPHFYKVPETPKNIQSKKKVVDPLQRDIRIFATKPIQFPANRIQVSKSPLFKLVSTSKFTIEHSKSMKPTTPNPKRVTSISQVENIDKIPTPNPKTSLPVQVNRKIPTPNPKVSSAIVPDPKKTLKTIKRVSQTSKIIQSSAAQSHKPTRPTDKMPPKSTIQKKKKVDVLSLFKELSSAKSQVVLNDGFVDSTEDFLKDL